MTVPEANVSTGLLRTGVADVVSMLTSPVGMSVPDAAFTVAVTLTAAPCSMEAGDNCSVVLVGEKVILLQSVTSSFTSTLPRPLARS